MVDISTRKHGMATPSKLLASLGGAHQFNITTVKNHDNGELALRGAWNSFDNYDEATGAIDFAGVIRQPSAEGGFYVEVTADTEALFLYNTPVSPYQSNDLRDEKLFYNAAGDVVRGYELRKGDIFSVTEELFEGTPVAGKTVTFADGKYVVA